MTDELPGVDGGRTSPRVPAPLPLRPPVRENPPPQAAPAPILRRAAVKTTPRPASRMLQAAPPPVSGQANGSSLAGGPIFSPNLGLRLAQLIALTQGVIALITGINLIQGGRSLASLATGVNLSTSAGIAANYGIGIVVVGALLIIGAILVAHPSLIVRTLLALLEVVLLGRALAAHFGGGSVLGFVTVLAMGASGSALIPFGAVVGLPSGAIYLLAIHPPTYRAFAR